MSWLKQADDLTYYDSADNVTISRMRALKELKDHGIDNNEGIEGFYKDLGFHDFYYAQDVLDWLGY